MKNIYNKIRTFSEKSIHNDKFVLIFSIFIGIFLWAYVTQKESPDTTCIIKDVSIDFDASLSGSQADINGYKIYDADKKTVDIKVTTNRTKLAFLSKDDFYAKISTDNYLESQPVLANIQLFKADGNNIDCTYQVEGSSKVSVCFYKEITKNFDITTINAPGVTAAKGYKLKETFCDSLSFTGPEPMLNSIDHIALNLNQNVSYDSRNTINVDANTDNITFYDGNGKIINSTLAPYLKNGTIKTNKQELTVTVNVAMIKELNITYALNYPSYFDPDFITSRLKLEPASIFVSCEDSTAESIENIPVSSDQNISLNSIGLNFTKIFDISKSLESYPELTNDSNITECVVTFDSTGIAEKTFDSLTRFYIKNPYDKYQADVVTSRLPNIKVYGPTADISKITADDFILEIDISKNSISGTGKPSPGRQTYPVLIKPADEEKFKNIWIYGEYTADVDITNIEDITTTAATFPYYSTYDEEISYEQTD